MAVRCATCSRQFGNIGEVADHISETRAEIEGTLPAEHESMEPDSPEHEENVATGFAHRKYYDRDGKLMPLQYEDYLYVLVMSGARWCSSCNLTFTNMYRFSDHILSAKHGDQTYQTNAKINMEKFENFQNTYF